MNVPDFVETVTVGNVITWVAFIAGLIVLIRKVSPILKKFSDTLDDIQGEKARPGVPARPGIMERLSKQDMTLNDISDKVSTMTVNHVAMLNSLNELKSRADMNQKGIARARRETRRVEIMLLQHIHDSKVWIADLGRNAEHYNFKVPEWPVRPAEDWLVNGDDNDESNPAGN